MVEVNFNFITSNNFLARSMVENTSIPPRAHAYPTKEEARDEDAYPKIQISQIHNIVARISILPYLETIKWIIDHV
jgi:hypothetical protein